MNIDQRKKSHELPYGPEQRQMSYAEYNDCVARRRHYHYQQQSRPDDMQWRDRPLSVQVGPPIFAKQSTTTKNGHHRDDSK
jgi:hypothetical protein